MLNEFSFHVSVYEGHTALISCFCCLVTHWVSPGPSSIKNLSLPTPSGRIGPAIAVAAKAETTARVAIFIMTVLAVRYGYTERGWFWESAQKKEKKKEDASDWGRHAVLYILSIAGKIKAQLETSCPRCRMMHGTLRTHRYHPCRRSMSASSHGEGKCWVEIRGLLARELTGVTSGRSISLFT